MRQRHLTFFFFFAGIYGVLHNTADVGNCPRSRLDHLWDRSSCSTDALHNKVVLDNARTVVDLLEKGTGELFAACAFLDRDNRLVELHEAVARILAVTGITVGKEYYWGLVLELEPLVDHTDKAFGGVCQRINVILQVIPLILIHMSKHNHDVLPELGSQQSLKQPQHVFCVLVQSMSYKQQ